jgi:general secretion pathway protein K
MKHHRGIALMIILLMLAVISPMLVKLAAFNSRSVQQTTAFYHTNTALYYALVAESWAKGILNTDKKESQHDGLEEAWAHPLEADGGVVTGRLLDLQGRFNLNNLAEKDEETYKTFIKLLKNLEFSDTDATQITHAIIDWIDKDAAVTQPGGAEDDYYISQIPPYRSAGQNMVSVTELKRIKGITAEVYQKLEPHVAALPATTKINVNTATEPLLKALFVKDDWGLIDQFISQRQGFGIATLDELKDMYNNATNKDLDESITDQLVVETGYFQAELLTRFGDHAVRMTTLLVRSKSSTTTYMRALGEAL